MIYRYRYSLEKYSLSQYNSSYKHTIVDYSKMCSIERFDKRTRQPNTVSYVKKLKEYYDEIYWKIDTINYWAT